MMIVYQPLMNKVKTIWICLLTLAFFSCSDSGEEALLTDALPSSPTADYCIMGTVVSENNANKALPGLLIEIIFEKPKVHIDTLFTDGSGKFEWYGQISTFGKDITLAIAATDTSGVYEPKVIPVSFKNDESQNPISWFMGQASKEIVIRLKERTNQQFIK